MSANVWKKSFFSQIGEVIAGGTPSTKISEYWNGDIPFVTPNDLSEQKSPFIHQTERNITTLGLNKSSANLLPKNTLIISTRAPIGYMALSNNECVTNQGCKSIVFDSDQCPLFFYYNAHNYIQKMKSLGSGTTFAEISKSDLGKIVITYPESFVVQQQISDILSTCDTVIQNTKKTIDKYKAIKQGMMQDLFTRGLTKDGKLRPSYKEAPELYKESELDMIPKEWEVNTTEFLAQRLWIGLVTTMTSHYVDEGIPLIRNSDISENKIEDVEIFLDYDFAKANASREVHLGDVVTVHTGDIGTSSVINEKYDGAHGFATINTTVNKTIINEDYYCRYMNSFEFKKQALRAITGDGRQNLNIYDFINLLIPYPNDIKEQTLIVDRLKSIDSTIQKEEAILEKYKNIKTGLMARLLTPPDDAEIIDETGETL